MYLDTQQHTLIMLLPRSLSPLSPFWPKPYWLPLTTDSMYSPSRRRRPQQCHAPNLMQTLIPLSERVLKVFVGKHYWNCFSQSAWNCCSHLEFFIWCVLHGVLVLMVLSLCHQSLPSSVWFINFCKKDRFACDIHFFDRVIVIATLHLQLWGHWFWFCTIHRSSFQIQQAF